MVETLENVFRVRYLDDNDEVQYSIDKDVDGYTRIDSEKPLVNSVIENDIGSIFKIDQNTNIYIKLLDKSSNLNCNTIEEEIDNAIDRIINILDKKSEGFYHETSFTNLLKIYKSGYIYSRNHLKKNEIDFEDRALNNQLTEYCLNIQKEFYKNLVRFYVYKNAPATYLFGKRSSCILVCDHQILKDESLVRYLTDGKATRKDTLMYRMNNYGKVLDYEKFLKEGKFKWYINEFDELSDRKSIEFNCENQVPIKYIKKIIFSNENEMKHASKYFKDWDVELEYNPDYFKRRGY